jgi:DNA-directed RNA polymerase subunit RPC12/RpoP
MTMPQFEVADVFRAGFDNYRQAHGSLPKDHYDVANAIMACHTSKSGGHVFRCADCGHDLISYNSCRNRHCPSCQGASRAKWVENRVKELLPVPYFHAVFTIPSELNPFILRNKECCYALLFKAVSETLLTLAKDPRRLGAVSGIIAVLHTWGQNLLDHPHLHCIVPNGGLAGDKWVEGKDKDFLFPVQVVSELFRGKFMAVFKKALQSGEIMLHGELQQYEKEPQKLKELIDCCYSMYWNIYLEPPFGSPEMVLKYIGRYTHRVAISNRRILSIDDTTVTFAWKDYSDNDRVKKMTLTHGEFIRRFLLHVLPKGFTRIRYYGFLSAPRRKECIRICKEQLLGKQVISEQLIAKQKEAVEKKDHVKCPQCGSTRMHKHQELLPEFYRNQINAAA